MSGGFKTNVGNLSAEEVDKARKLYPERGGEKFEPGWFNYLWRGEGKSVIDKIKCERNVYKTAMKSPIVKLLLSALKSSGCPVDLRRHISCEACDISVTGGYDPSYNQVVVCQNTARSFNMVQGALAHELIHMFDYCRRKMDLDNIQHLACTEIRAANLVHCSFLSAFIEGSASLFTIKNYHRNCVKLRAMKSVMAVRDVTQEEAWEAVKPVFDKCYNDLEPFGRRIRRSSDHMERAYDDRIGMGYV